MDNYSTPKTQTPYNPFLDDDENIDDLDFLNHPQQGSSGYMLGNDKPNQEWEQKRKQLLEERRQIEERTLMSTNKSLGLVYESEQIGIQTAEVYMKNPYETWLPQVVNICFCLSSFRSLCDKENN